MRKSHKQFHFKHPFSLSLRQPGVPCFNVLISGRNQIAGRIKTGSPPLNRVEPRERAWARAKRHHPSSMLFALDSLTDNVRMWLDLRPLADRESNNVTLSLKRIGRPFSKLSAASTHTKCQLGHLLRCQKSSSFSLEGAQIRSNFFHSFQINAASGRSERQNPKRKSDFCSKFVRNQGKVADRFGFNSHTLNSISCQGRQKNVRA